MPETLFTEKQFRDSVELVNQLKRRGQPIDAVHILFAAIVITYKMTGQHPGSDEQKLDDIRNALAQFWDFLLVDPKTGVAELRKLT